MKKKIKWWRWASLGCLSGLLVIGLVALGIGLAPNWVNNLNPLQKPHMKEVAWGQFAPLPENAKDFWIETSGGPFTRTFDGSFSAPKEEVEQWIDDSRGLDRARETKSELDSESGTGETEIRIEPGGGAQGGDVRISRDRTKVFFHVWWS